MSSSSFLDATIAKKPKSGDAQRSGPVLLLLFCSHDNGSIFRSDDQNCLTATSRPTYYTTAMSRNVNCHLYPLSYLVASKKVGVGRDGLMMVASNFYFDEEMGGQREI